MSKISRICPECNQSFQRESWDIKKYEKKGKIPCCSRSCSAKISNRNRYQKRTLVCLGCQQEFLVNQSSQKDKYCSKKCYGLHQRGRLVEQARSIGKENAQKISETLKKKFASGELVHPMLGKNHSEKTKKKLSQKRKEYYEENDGYWKGKKLPEKTKRKMSETRTRKWINGEYDHLKMAWAKGYYFFQKADREVYYRSSWELAYMKYLDQSKDVLSATYERMRIPYYRHGNKRWYVVDLLVHYSNRSELIEIKPQSMMYYPVNVLKFKAARKYCKENNIKFKVVTERYLKHIGAMSLL